MQILILTQRWYPDTFGGSEYIASEQARWLVKRGHKVVVVTERVQDKLPYDIIEDDLRLIRYGNEKMLARFGGRSRTDLGEVPRVIKELCCGTQFDAVIAHHPFVGAGFLRSGLKIPMFYVFHAPAVKEIQFEGTDKFPISNFQFPIIAFLLARGFACCVGFVEQWVLKKADSIAVFSDFSKQILKDVYPVADSKIINCLAGIDIKRFKPGRRKKNKRKMILTVRRLISRMGLLQLVQAMAIVCKKLPSAELNIVGSGPLRDTIKQEIKKCGLRGKVKLVGAVSPDKLPSYYQTADLFVLPTVVLEGLGIATLEALVSGLPVVGTPVGAIPEMLKQIDCRLLTKSATVEDLAQGILDFFALSEQECRDIKIKARNLVKEKYNWDKAIDQLELILNELVNRETYHAK